MISYKVVNREANQSLTDVYATFMEAFRAQQAWDRFAVVECHDSESDSVEVVWERDYEHISYIENIYLNSYTPK